MKGEFKTAYNEMINVLPAFILVFGPSIMWVFDNYIGTALVLIITMAVALAPEFIRSQYTADDEGVRIRVLFRTYRFSYSDIRSVEIERHDGGHSRIGDTICIVTELTLNTDDDLYCFRTVQSFSMNEQLRDTKGFENELNEIGFAQLGRFIETRIN